MQNMVEVLISEYNGLLTRDEEQLQFLLDLVEQHRQQYPDCLTSTLGQQSTELRSEIEWSYHDSEISKASIHN